MSPASPDVDPQHPFRGLLNVAAILIVVGGVMWFFWNRASHPAPQAAIAPDLVAYMAREQMRLTRRDGKRWIVPQQDVRWSGLLDCERWTDPSRRSSGGRYGNTNPGPPTWTCVIGITGPKGEDVSVTVRLGYPSRRSSGQVTGYTLAPGVGGFHVFPVTGSEAVTFLAKRGITAQSHPASPP